MVICLWFLHFDFQVFHGPCLFEGNWQDEHSLIFWFIILMTFPFQCFLMEAFGILDSVPLHQLSNHPVNMSKARRETGGRENCWGPRCGYWWSDLAIQKADVFFLKRYFLRSNLGCSKMLTKGGLEWSLVQIAWFGVYLQECAFADVNWKHDKRWNVDGKAT